MTASCTFARSHAFAALPVVGFQAGILAAQMLKSYLNSNITASTIAEIVAAIQKNHTHALIVDWVQRKVQEFVDSTGSIPNDSQLFDLCADAIATFQMTAPGPAAADAPSSVGGRAYFSEELQAVIGGINDMILSEASGLARSDTGLTYRGTYAIRDTYDFDNDRSMFPAYDNYRKELTRQFASDPIRCVLRFDADLFVAPLAAGNAKTGPLIKSHVFTCFMYAIEINGCTSPLFWEAEIPFTASANLRGSAPLPQPPTPPLPPPTPPVPRPPHPPKKRTGPPRPMPIQPGPPSGTVYTVQRGDNLSKIAKQYYGNESDWAIIYKANIGTIGSNPNLIYAGQKLIIP